ncbi:MAG: MFS transporter [Cytophagaceae bacterium]
MDKIQLGLKENWKQFALLVIINGFVGGMIGLERTILPKIAEVEFQIAARTAILSFIVVFGIVKAFTNYFTGSLANRFGRKNLLLAGWIIGIPVPFILIYAPSWNWIVAANILLGINQGLTWSSTVVMKIDLIGEKNRGLAMGLNEFAGYLAVAGIGFATGYIAGQYGLRPYPFYLGIGLVFAGLFLTLFVKDTIHHSNKESESNSVRLLRNIFWDTTWKDKNLGSITQAGLVNNLNDGMAWGLFPILFLSKGFSLSEVGILTAVYPAVWGVAQLITGKIADHASKKKMLSAGMFIQGMVLIAFPFTDTFRYYFMLSTLLGLGTAIVYPTFLASIAEYTNPSDRPKSLGTFRFWRDLGYAFGALLTGIVADVFGVNYSIVLIGLITIGSSIIVMGRMR